MASSSDLVETIRDACHRARHAFSFSSFRGRDEVGTHLLRINGYSSVEKKLPHGRCIESPAFRAGGHTWTVWYYPNGYSIMTDAACVRLNHKGISFLGIGNKLLGDRAGVTASYKVAILDHDGNEVDSWCLSPQHFEQRDWGWFVLTDLKGEERREKLRLMEKDTLFIKCEVSVKKVDKESRIKMFLRELLD